MESDGNNEKERAGRVDNPPLGQRGSHMGLPIQMTVTINPSPGLTKVYIRENVGEEGSEVLDHL